MDTFSAETSLFETSNNILLIKKLLQPNQKDDSSSDSDEDIQKRCRQFGPSQIGPKLQTKKTTKKPEKEPEKTNENPTIDEWLEKQEKEDADALETRKRPEYTITYKQAVGTEDLFLQMGNRTNASSSCEDMIIEIQIPEETVEVHQMDISVTEKEIDFASPVYRLKLPLMHPINPDRSSAKYYTERKVLCLTCRMNREYDYVNF